MILSAGQDIQLHLHTEWLKILEVPIQPIEGQSGNNMADYSESAQSDIISLGLDLFKFSGFENEKPLKSNLLLTAFRYIEQIKKKMVKR